MKDSDTYTWAGSSSCRGCRGGDPSLRSLPSPWGASRSPWRRGTRAPSLSASGEPPQCGSGRKTRPGVSSRSECWGNCGPEMKTEELYHVRQKERSILRTCIKVVFSLIQICSDDASSLKCCSFLWPSASKRGWPGGGSGNTSYNWDTYVMIDFSSGSGVSTSGKGFNGIWRLQ